MVRLRGLQTFTAIVEAGSISAAARRLSISKSVVSQRLADLESELESRLLQRSTRQMVLTDEGSEFYERCVQILADITDATDAIAERQGKIRGPLRLATSVSFGTLHLGPALLPFLETHPQVDLNLDLNDRMIDIVSEGFDMTVRIGRLPDSTLIARKLTISRRVVVCSPAYVSKNGMPKNVMDLENHSCISYSNITSMNEWGFENNGETNTVSLRTRLQVNSGDVQRDAAAAGLGIAILPTFLVSDYVGQGKLVVVQLEAEAVPDTIYAVYPQNRHLSAKVRALADHLQKIFWQSTILGRTNSLEI